MVYSNALEWVHALQMDILPTQTWSLDTIKMTAIHRSDAHLGEICSWAKVAKQNVDREENSQTRKAGQSTHRRGWQDEDKRPTIRARVDHVRPHCSKESHWKTCKHIFQIVKVFSLFSSGWNFPISQPSRHRAIACLQTVAMDFLNAI